MGYQGNQELYAMEQGAPYYNKVLVGLFSSFLPPSSRGKSKVLDFGAGIGTLAVEWQKRNSELIHCLEPDHIQSEIVKGRGIKCFNQISEVTVKYDLVFSSNVLEHIEEDISVLNKIREKLLNHKALLIIYVPAFQFLYSEVDRKLGHFRRYSKDELIYKVRESGLHVINCQYVDSLGFIASLIVKLLKLGTEVTNSSWILFLYDKIVFPLSRVIDTLGAKRLIGKNLLLVARKE